MALKNKVAIIFLIPSSWQFHITYANIIEIVIMTNIVFMIFCQYHLHHNLTDHLHD